MTLKISGILFKRNVQQQLWFSALLAKMEKKMLPIFFPSGLKITADVYLDVVKKKVISWVTSNLRPDTKIMFQQYGALVHTAKKVQKWLSTNMPKFWSKEKWLPSRPYLNTLDYTIHGKIESKVCTTSHPNMKSLEIKIIKNHWSKMKEPYTRKFSHGPELAWVQ